MNFHLKILKIFSNFSISFDFLSKSAKNSSKIFSLYYKIVKYISNNHFSNWKCKNFIHFHQFSLIFMQFFKKFARIFQKFSHLYIFLIDFWVNFFNFFFRDGGELPPSPEPPPAGAVRSLCRGVPPPRTKFLRTPLPMQVNFMFSSKD